MGSTLTFTIGPGACMKINLNVKIIAKESNLFCKYAFHSSH